MADDPSTTPDDDPDAHDHLLTLEQLAELSGIAARTIRYYQGEKLLQKPARDPKDGRVARYGEEHAERLRLIGELRDRGLKLPAIRNLLEEGDASTRVADWLGLDESLRGAWGHDGPTVVTRDQLAEILAGSPPGTQGQLEDARILHRQGNVWLLPAPNLLQVILDLVAGGVELDLVLEAGSILQQQLGKAADQLIELFIDALGQGFGRGTDTAELVEALRPASVDAAGIIFGLQLERAIGALLADTRRIGKR